ncbi:uncharacterized protein LOC124286098 [Haliotis rubra]|uniref:uncharacterized protein LOC124286098 n=1 Tax=Haliotis rubra TaxID=36100 RepID=UPI001EE5C6F9|nr:uncharacterized protein LOC124286098 [Haliotis rubra]
MDHDDLNPWWQVDLQAVYRISRVQIVGRSDCCAERLNDFAIEMYVEDPAVTVRILPWLCHFYKGVFRPTTQDIKCDSVVSGRFVRLSRKNIRHPGQLFTLCEVSVYGPDTYAVDTGRNLALRKPAKASSTYTASYQIWASNVVDGSPSGNFNDLTCHSGENGDLNPWWQVDLQAVYRISRVQIVGRSDCCATEWLHDFSIEMYVEDPAVSVSIQPWLCHFYKGVFKPTTQDIKCDSVVAGRFVRLSRNNTRDPEKTLQLCEVSVYGPETYAYFRKTNLSLTDVIVTTLPLGILHCSVICTTNPLCMAVKVVSDGTPACQLVYRSVHRARETALTLSNFFVPTFSQLDV